MAAVHEQKKWVLHTMRGGLITPYNAKRVT